MSSLSLSTLYSFSSLLLDSFLPLPSLPMPQKLSKIPQVLSPERSPKELTIGPLTNVRPSASPSFSESTSSDLVCVVPSSPNLKRYVRDAENEVD